MLMSFLISWRVLELEQETMTGHESVTSPEGSLSEDGSEMEVQLP